LRKVAADQASPTMAEHRNTKDETLDHIEIFMRSMEERLQKLEEARKKPYCHSPNPTRSST
jgi:hypothetical protein